MFLSVMDGCRLYSLTLGVTTVSVDLKGETFILFE